MKQYVLDELRLEDYNKIKLYFDENYFKLSLDGLYQIELKDQILSDLQKQHTKCAPFYFIINLQEFKLSCELLIRTFKKIRCDCIGYANVKQRNWIIELIDGINDCLDILT